MNLCKICSKNFPLKRKELGYEICIECGDKEAIKEYKRKSKCIAPLFNKGAYQYIGNIEEAKFLGR
tara:strand:- start:845 stop:1042 length:198 start_codon:yes stop_codon:yes gene_type:complete